MTPTDFTHTLRRALYSPTVLLAFALTACGGGSSPLSNNNTTQNPTSPPPGTPSTPAAEVSGNISLFALGPRLRPHLENKLSLKNASSGVTAVNWTVTGGHMTDSHPENIEFSINPNVRNITIPVINGESRTIALRFGEIGTNTVTAKLLNPQGATLKVLEIPAPVYPDFTNLESAILGANNRVVIKGYANPGVSIHLSLKNSKTQIVQERLIINSDPSTGRWQATSAQAYQWQDTATVHAEKNGLSSQPALICFSLPNRAC